MKSDSKLKPSAAVPPRGIKRPYASPRFKEFGKVRLLTQGVGSQNGDGGQSMKDKP